MLAIELGETDGAAKARRTSADEKNIDLEDVSLAGHTGRFAVVLEQYCRGAREHEPVLLRCDEIAAGRQGLAVIRHDDADETGCAAQRHDHGDGALDRGALRRLDVELRDRRSEE